MASDTPPSRLLDQLRAQSSALRAHEVEHRPVEDTLREIDRHLWKAFRWLDEALHHLEVIQPHVRHTFQLSGVLAIQAPRYERGFVSYRRRPLGGMDLLDHVELFYRLSSDEPVIVKVQPGAATAVEERLRAAHLQFRYETEQDEFRVVRQGIFRVTPAITASVRFEPDYRNQRIEVTLRNIDRFESVVLDFAGDGLGEDALEALVQFILGEGNQFLRRAPLAGIGRRKGEAGPAGSNLTEASKRAHV